MPFQRILERLKYGVWFCTPTAHASAVEVVNICVDRARNGGNLDFIPGNKDGISLSDMRTRKPISIDRDGIASIHILGLMARNIAPIEKMCGRTDYADIEQETKEAQKSARAVMYEFDTSGGTAMGIDQTAKALSDISIPSAGYTETMSASAGVYLGAGLGRMFVASGGVMGSVGAVLPWEDTSRVHELSGKKITMFHSEGAILKGLNPNVPLSAEQEQWLKDFTEFQGAMFREHLTNFRRVDDEVFRGGLYFGGEAVRVGLADEVGGQDAARAYLLTQLQR